MLIPKKVRVGKTTYTVVLVDKLEKQLARGTINYSTGIIKLALRDNCTGRAVSDGSRTHVFWHEIMHAVLHDMKHRLANNELFVNEVAKRLTNVVETARL